MSQYSKLLDRNLQILVLIYQLIAVVAFGVAIVQAISWMRLPFLGAFFEHTLVFNDVGPSQAHEAWALHQQGIDSDQLIAINDIPVRSADDVMQILARFFPGENVTISIRTPQGESKTLPVTLHVFPEADRLTYVYLPFMLGAVFLAMSMWIFAVRRREVAGRAFAIFGTSLAIGSFALFDLYTTHRLTYLWTFAIAMGGGALIDLSLSFPQEARFVIKWPYLRWLGYFFAILLSLYAFTTLFNFSQPLAYYAAWRWIYLYMAVSFLVYLGVNVYSALTSPSPVIKAQARTIVIGAILAFGPLAIWLATTPVHAFVFSPFLLIPVILFPAVLGYTILRFRLLRAEDLLRLGIVYLFLTVLVMGGYALLVSGVTLIFSTAVPTTHPLLVGGLAFLLALMLEPLRARLQGIVDATFFRGQRAYAERLQDFSHQMTTALDLRTIGQILRQQIFSALAPERIHIYTYDALNDQFVALPAEDGRPSSDIRFAASSSLVRYFATERVPLYLDGNRLPPALAGEQTRLALLGAHLFVALPGKESPNGWIALGPRRSGQPYTPRDLAFLENLGDQASVAIARVQTIANLERRVQEMNALTRVSQGVNVTLSFDDVLELIYAQTAQIIPASHLHVSLYNRAGDYYYYAFCVEDSDRLRERENVPFPAERGLSPQVIRRGRPIWTQDYLQECQSRGVTPALKGVFAWAGVPLNAGPETIGALSVASNDPAVTYTKSQVDLLQAIADQTAGAIVKARLLEETQKRAQQLAMLNEIARKLTGTLEIEPLLQNILKSAVEILNCEAGSLLLVDEQTEELIFKVTVGPVAANLVGQRLPPGTGIVGRAVQARRAVIENDAQHSPQRFDLDRQTGFVSRSLLAVPLQIKERVLGVVEVINRRDGLPFTEDDQTLLTAFASQAAVALENARLYTLTDQELAARVEELSIMQRIDRELNASLEMDRAMRITLEWAMRQSKAEAGLIGVLEDEKLRIMAAQGYDEKQASKEMLLPLHLPAMRAAVESGQPQQVNVQKQGGLLPSAHMQIVIPIRREAQVIGLLMLESSSDSQEDIAFLNRLSDHAAIAISNAQLYGEVQRANLAKSEFVSFVAHELKNPMTSIKGYTELLAAGAVGPISEMQANFLNTIRSNVERMATLVSDLNDQSKIEAGRLRLEYKAVAIADVVDEVLRSTRRQIEEKKQTITVEIPAQLPAVWADRTRLGQVLTNLVSNAHKYTPEGGQIIVGAEAADNQWDPQGAARVVHVWVRDTGIGISVEDQPKIFQKFFRSEDQKAREAPGTGLGLNITRSLVEMQGGRIWFESEFRKGTTFHFTVPVAEG